MISASAALPLPKRTRNDLSGCCSLSCVMMGLFVCVVIIVVLFENKQSAES